MKFHLPSFLLGVAVGAGGAVMWDRLRPLALELSGAGAQLVDALWERIAIWQEDAEDAAAAAQARHAAKVTPMRGRRVAHTATGPRRARTAAGARHSRPVRG
jgi:hypothetical protein